MILYMIAINYKLNVENISSTIIKKTPIFYLVAANHLLAPNNYLSGGLPWLHLSPTPLGLRFLGYHVTMEYHMSKVLTFWDYTRLSHISFINSLEARLSNVSDINLLMA